MKPWALNCCNRAIVCFGIAWATLVIASTVVRAATLLILQPNGGGMSCRRAASACSLQARQGAPVSSIPWFGPGSPGAHNSVRSVTAPARPLEPGLAGQGMAAIWLWHRETQPGDLAGAPAIPRDTGSKAT